MKKVIVLAVALVLVLGIAGYTLAQSAGPQGGMMGQGTGMSGGMTGQGGMMGQGMMGGQMHGAQATGNAASNYTNLCSTCHGVTGKGDGPAAAALRRAGGRPLTR